MNWGSVDAFLDMGGYGLYVWGSYGVAVLAISVDAFHRALGLVLEPLPVSEQITVRAPRLTVPHTTSATRTDTSLVNVPQAITVVTKDFIADQAPDGEEGFALASDRQYDVLIVDRMLPKRDGLSIIDELRREAIAQLMPEEAAWGWTRSTYLDRQRLAVGVTD